MTDGGLPLLIDREYELELLPACLKAGGLNLLVEGPVGVERLAWFK